MTWFKRHLSARLLLLVFLLSVLPYAAVLLYNHFSEERLTTEHFMQEHRERMQRIAKEIDTHFTQLHRELEFLAGSVVMDDLLIDDLDRRIASLLERYKAVNALDVELLAIGVNGKVIASTRQTRLGEPYEKFKAFEAGLGRSHPVWADEQTLLLQVPVFNGLGKERIIGYLLMEYARTNLDRFNVHGGPVETVLFNTEGTAYIGSVRPPIGKEPGQGMIQSDRGLWLIGKAGEQLPGWYIGYRVDRSEQQSAVGGLNRFLVLMLLLGMVTIAVVSYWFSRKIVAPLVTLEQEVAAMVKAGNYAMPVTVQGDDEIGRLAGSFNALAHAIQEAFETLRRENFYRLTRLTQMIGLFNRLMETAEESDTLKTALTQIKTLAPEYNVRFSRYSENTGMPALYVYDFDHDTLKYYGSLIIPEGLSEEEQAFFRAVASMIAARIEQIRAFERLRRDTEAKTAFISHMSHDLRTPLHAILSQTQFLIGYGHLDNADMERVGGIEHAAQQLLGMINDLLELARLDSGKYEPELETLSSSAVVDILEEVGMLLEPLAEQKGIELRVSSQAPEGSVVADRRFLRQIVLNLISNAVKFTDEGSVSCRLEDTGDGLCLFVQDTGRGMDARQLERLFEPFVQTSGEDSSRGSGLGLALSRRFAQLFGAELVLHSDGPGRGSVARLCFTTL